MEFKDKTSNSQSIHQADVSSRLPNFFGRALLRPPLPVQVLWWSDWHFFVKVKIIGHYIAHCAQRYDSNKSHLMRSCYFSFFSAEPLNGSISRASGIFHDDRGLWSKWSKSFLSLNVLPLTFWNFQAQDAVFLIVNFSSHFFAWKIYLCLDYQTINKVAAPMIFHKYMIWYVAKIFYSFFSTNIKCINNCTEIFLVDGPTQMRPTEVLSSASPSNNHSQSNLITADIHLWEGRRMVW